MSGSKTMVLLANTHKSVGDRSLEKSHAERTLRRSNTGGWHLPKDSKFEMTEDGLIKKSSRRSSQESSEQG
jgi:hypothetical protein